MERCCLLCLNTFSLKLDIQSWVIHFSLTFATNLW